VKPDTPPTSDAIAPSDAAIAQAFNEYLDVHYGNKGADTVMTEIWERAKQLTAEEIVTGEGSLTYSQQRTVIEHMTTELCAAKKLIDSSLARAEAIDCQPLAAREIAAQPGEGESEPASVSDMADAYHGAMEDKDDWKRRAQVAEAELRRFGYRGVTANQSPKPVGYANIAEFNAKNGGFICKREGDPSFFPIPMFARTD
jgi:hypothetical protein